MANPLKKLAGWLFGDKFLQLNWQDLVRGIVVAIITAFLTALLPVLQSGSFPTKAQLMVAVSCGVTAAIAYIIKNLLTNSKDQLFVPEPKPTDDTK